MLSEVKITEHRAQTFMTLLCMLLSANSPLIDHGLFVVGLRLGLMSRAVCDERRYCPTDLLASLSSSV